MSARTPFDYDVSVTADKRRRMRRRATETGQSAAERRCDWEGCACAGRYRAPRGPDRLDQYWWFCLDHVREWNRGWDYFRDWSEADFEAQSRADMVWDRPTWRMGGGGRAQTGGAHAEGRAWARFGFDDPLDLLGDNATLNPGRAGRERVAAEAPSARRLPPALSRAFEVLGAPDSAGRAELRRRYRALVKDLHPDMNGGRRDAEARLSEVLWAWDQVRDSRLIPD